MPLALTNTPSTSQQFVNNCLKKSVELFCTTYLEDNFIHSNSLEEHRIQVTKVLTKLPTNVVLLKPENCEFYTQTMTNLGLIISPEGISMDSAEVKAVQKLNTPRNFRGVQSCLQFANCYRQFIRRVSVVANPVTQLTRKNLTFA